VHDQTEGEQQADDDGGQRQPAASGGAALASMLGSRVTTIAFPMLVLYLTGSPVAAGWVAFAATAPTVLFYIPAGALVDLMDPKRVMLLSEFGRGVAISWVVVMVATGWRSIALFIVVAVLEETLEVFSTLAERRYVGSLVARDQASPALVRVEARTHVVVLMGRPLGGLLFELAPIAPFLFDMMTFIGSITALLGIKRRQETEWATLTSTAKEIGAKGGFRRATTRLDQPPDWHIKKDIREGLGWLWKKPFARDAMALLAGTTLINQALIMVFIAEAHSQRLSAISVGIVLAMSGLGGILGAMLASRLRILVARSLIQIQMLVWSGTYVILTVSGGQLPTYTAIVMAVSGFVGAMGNIAVETYVAENVPANMLARVTSIGRTGIGRVPLRELWSTRYYILVYGCNCSPSRIFSSRTFDAR
jgi:MFS family permease